MTGVWLVRRISRQTSTPSRPGMARSRRTRSGASSSNLRRAASPSYAVITWCPAVPTRAVIAPTMAGSSSTTRIRSPAACASVIRPLPSVRCDGGKRDHEPASPETISFDPDLASHGPHQATRGVEPDPGTAAPAPGGPDERLEDRFPVLRRYAGPVVGGIGADLARLAPGADRDAPVARRV